jgi:hypothetical protein
MRKQGEGKPRINLVIWVAAAICLYLIFAVISVQDAITIQTSNPQNVWDSGHLLPQAFFAMFWFSGHELLRHFMVAHGMAMPAPAWLQQTLRVSLISNTPFFHLTWLYPPIMGLLAMLYACLPLKLSFWVWRGLYFVISGLLLRRAGLGWAAIAMGLLSPAAMIDLVEGENGTLTGGLVAAALLLAEAAPKRAGLLAALLSIKPQIGVTLPFMLLQPRLRPALFTAVAGVIVLALATLPFFGIQGWEWFLFHSTHSSSNLVATPFSQVFPEAGSTVFYMARSFGLGVHGAMIAQGCSALASALALWQLWRVPGRAAAPRMAATLALSVLLAPYGYLYDLVGFSVGMAAMCLAASPARKPVYAAFWLFAGHSATIAGLTGHILMPVAAALAALMAWQEAAAPQTPPHAHNPASGG